MDLFRSEDITLELLPYVTEAQLQRIWVRTLGQRMRIVRSVQDQLEDRGEDAVSERPVAEEKEYVTERPNANEPDNEIEVAVPKNQIDGGNENNQLETTRRGDEVPEVYRETLVKGDKKFVKIKVGNDRFDRQYTKKWKHSLQM